MMNDIMSQISRMGIIPVLKIENPQQASLIAKSLCEGGLPCAEVTFRTAAAPEAIKEINKSYPDMLVGAGTVLTCSQADAAFDSGAKFIVTPGLNPSVVSHCINLKIPIIPGVNSPSEMEAALSFGLNVVKFFPAEQSGGLEFLKAVSAPYPMMKFIPTGGINISNLNQYLTFNKVLACGGSWMVKPELIESGDYSMVTALTKAAVQAMIGLELAHIGVNCDEENDAEDAARELNKLLGFPINPGNSSIFSASFVEFVKEKGLGKKGHIAFSTISLPRAIARFEANGMEFLYNTAKYDHSNRIKAIYLKNEIAGFAIHLMQK